MTFTWVKNIAGVPLASLSAVVLDTETTGLDTSKARIIQIGAVRVGAGVIDETTPYDALVNPGEPIPASSTEIHGIYDHHVKDAKAFHQVMPEFADWTGQSVILGYSLGFDVAIFQAEHERAGLKWQKPRCLDVRHLVQILSPNLPDSSLDTVAGWLNIEVENRHQALGDALLTAKVFQALTPRLRKKGITTLTQAEQACLALSQEIQGEVQAGWHEIVTQEKLVPRSVAEYARIDSYPYRHRVRDVMHAPPQIVGNEMKLGKVLGVLMKNQISSVFVEPLGTGDEHGIVTERDILRAIDAHKEDALQHVAGEFAVRPLDTIGADEFVYRAIGKMSLQGYRHLGVSDAAGGLVGALSARDLLRQRASDALSLGDAIEHAERQEDLGRIWADLTVVARGLVYEEVDARDIAAVISRELRALTHRACEIAEAEMAAKGKGAPPVPYAMLVLGSGGRGESLLAMDQDNAIIFTQGEPGGEADLWFKALGERVSEILDYVGVAYCKGGIMASSADWRMDFSGWREEVASWLNRSRPQDVLNADIFFDSISVHGDHRLGDELHNEALGWAKGAKNFLKLLTVNAVDFKVPLGWLGRFKLEDNRMDLKIGGIMPIFSAARVLALKNGISARSTYERFEAVRDQMEQGPAFVDNILDAHRILLEAILKQQLRDLDVGHKLSNKVAPSEMSSAEREELRWALQQVENVPSLLGDPIVFG